MRVAGTFVELETHGVCNLVVVPPQRPRLAAEAACAGFHHRAKIPARASIPAAWPTLIEPRRQIRQRFDLLASA
jgi:hypothetical protein